MWANSLQPQLDALGWKIRNSFQDEVEQALGMSYHGVDERGIRGAYWHPEGCRAVPGPEGYHYFRSSRGIGVYFERKAENPNWRGESIIRKLDIPETSGIRGIVDRVKPQIDRSWPACTHPRKQEG